MTKILNELKKDVVTILSDAYLWRSYKMCVCGSIAAVFTKICKKQHQPHIAEKPWLKFAWGRADIKI